MKLNNMTNKEKFLNILEHIKEIGFTPYNVWFNDDEYLDEKTSICEFKIKEIKGFLFAMWSLDRLDSLEYQMKQDYIDIWTDYLDIHHRSEIVFFTQYTRDIDKFKPSNSGFVTGMFRYSYKDNNNLCEKWDFGSLDKILVYMKKHRVRSVEYTGCMTRYIWEDDRGGIKLGLIFIKDWLYTFIVKFREYIKYKYLIFISKHFINKLTMSQVLLFDWGNSWYPRIHIYIRRKTEINLQKYEQEKLYVTKFENKYFNDIGIVSFDIDILSNDLIEDDLDRDKELQKKFYFILDSYHNKVNEKSEFKLLYEKL